MAVTGEEVSPHPREQRAWRASAVVCVRHRRAWPCSDLRSLGHSCGQGNEGVGLGGLPASPRSGGLCSGT